MFELIKSLHDAHLTSISVFIKKFVRITNEESVSIGLRLRDHCQLRPYCLLGGFVIAEQRRELLAHLLNFVVVIFYLIVIFDSKRLLLLYQTLAEVL